MAITKIWDVKHRLDRLIHYVMNPHKTHGTGRYELMEMMEYVMDEEKTDEMIFVSGVNIADTFDAAYRQMLSTKRRYGKEDGIIAFHGVQSFAPGESTPETAHEIGVKLAQALWGERFEVIVTTHLDKEHLHNHFLLNSVSFMDGYRYYDNKATYREMRVVSDRLCKEYGLSVIERPGRGQGRQYAEWKADEEGKPTWRNAIRAEIDEVISGSVTWNQFVYLLRRRGYAVKTNVKHIAVRPPGKERFVRLRSLGDAYTEEAIWRRIREGPITAPTLARARRVPKRAQARLRGSMGKRPREQGDRP